MLKMRIFWKKTVKNRLRLQTPVCLRRPGAPPPDLRVVALAHYYIFVEFISCAKCLLLP